MQTNLIESMLIPRKTDGTEALISQIFSREVISPQTNIQDHSWKGDGTVGAPLRKGSKPGLGYDLEVLQGNQTQGESF